MTKDEFRDWITYHNAAYPGLTKWFQEIDDPAATKGAWYKLFANVTLKAAKAATDQAYRDNVKMYGFQEHGTTIAKLAREADFEERFPLSRKHEDQRRFKCPHCLDTGFTAVWHPKTMGDVLHKREPVRKYTCAVACECDTGADKKEGNDRLDGNLKRGVLPQFNSDLMVRCAGRSDGESFEYLARNIDQIAGNLAKHQTNYDDTFDQYNRNA